METFPQSWVIMLDQLLREGKPYNSSDMLAHQLKEHVTKARHSLEGMKEEIYMSAYNIRCNIFQTGVHGLGVGMVIGGDFREHIL